MPPRKKTETVTTDPKAVLDLETVAKEVSASPIQENDTAPTADQIELAELRAQLAEFKAREEKQSSEHRAPVYEPVDESTLTPEQIQIRSLQDQLAKAKGKDIDKGEDVYEENVDGGILVHFLEDGVTSNGRNFYRGQEVTFGPEAYAETLDRNGNSWINLTDDEQYARWGSVKFRKGAWPGRRTYEEESLKNVSITDQAPLTRI